MAVRIDNKRQKEVANVAVITPHGAEITVTASRAEALIARAPLTFADGKYRKYAYAGESNEVAVPTRTAANAPRKGTGANSGSDE